MSLFKKIKCVFNFYAFSKGENTFRHKKRRIFSKQKKINLINKIIQRMTKIYILKRFLRSSMLNPPPERCFPVKTAEANSSLCSCNAFILSSTVFELTNLKKNCMS